MASGTGKLARLLEMPLARVVAYYVLLFAGMAVAVRLYPPAGGLVHPTLPLDGSAFDLGRTAGAPVFAPPSGGPLTALALMAGACLLMLPVAWIYIETRQRKGYRQSLVHTLIILPLVVAGVVLLVKNSVALAFSLAGIVAAVSFRNNLRDTKDAVHIFLAIAVGLAAGVQALGVAATFSVAFNVVVVLLWWTDFGREPAGLRGARARRRLARAAAARAPSQTFVSQLDEQILRSLAPEQLDAIAERALLRRQKEIERLVHSDGGVVKAPAPPQRLEVVVPGLPAPARRAVEEALNELAKRWTFVGLVVRDGAQIAEYDVRLRKRVPAEQLMRELRTRAGPLVTRVELRSS